MHSVVISFLTSSVLTLSVSASSWAQDAAIGLVPSAIERQQSRQIEAALPHIDTKALHAALASLDAHGLRGGYYQQELQRMQDMYADEARLQQKQHELLREVVADLRFGLGRAGSSKAVAERAAYIDRQVALLASCTDMVACFQSIAARDRQYVPLQMMLAEYREIEQHGGWPIVSSGSKIERGASGIRVVEVASLLAETGDYATKTDVASTPASGGAAITYDAALEDAVKRFQARHGLEADGVIGPKTLGAMNAPVSKRIEQIELSLDRLRQLPDSPAGQHIRVNIPSYSLQAFNQDAVVLEMDVIVGQVSRKTPLFNNAITSLVLNPTWTPTPRIIREDILPKARNNPGYLSGSYVVTDSYTGERLDPYSVDWSSVSAGDVRIMQQSGAGNALGKVKFDMPSSDAIYLHDTSKPYLFKEAYRALSSGCVRVSEPDKLFGFITGAQGDAFAKKATGQYSSTAHTRLKLEKPVPVLATYFTAWVNNSGQIEFFDDVYSRDNSARLAWNKQERQQYLSSN